MKELFQLSFRCTKLKCGDIWAFVVMSASGPQRGRHLGSAACHVPCEKHGDSTQNINTNWKTCEIQVESFWECSTSVFILLFYICFVFIRNPASTLFLLILSRCNFLFRSKCYDIVYYNCKLKLWTFKAGSKNIYGLFIKYILYIHLTNESCKHFKFSPLTRTAQKVVQSFWMLQGLIIANADPSVLWLNNFYLFIAKDCI